MRHFANSIWNRRLALCLAVGLFCAATAQAATPVRWKFKQGEDLNYVMERQLEGKINLSGAEIEFKLRMVMDTSWKVGEVAKDGSADVGLTVDRMQFSMSSPLGGDLDYDSAKAEEPNSPAWGMLAPMVNGMLGQTIKAKMSPLGKVSDVQLPEKLAEIVGKQAGGHRQQGFGIGGNMFSEQGIKELIARAVLPLPEGAPDKEVTWKQTFSTEIPGIGTQTSDTTLSFDGTEKIDGKELQKISAKTELMFEPAENPRADLEITAQEGSGVFLFDVAAGRLFKSSGTQLTSMELSGPQELTQELKETASMVQGKSPAAEKAAEKSEAK